MHIRIFIAEATDVCKANPGRLFSSSQSCAHYYNCTGQSTNITKANECKYPDLFSTDTQRCQNFELVNCTSRQEPQAPCKLEISSTLDSKINGNTFRNSKSTIDLS